MKKLIEICLVLVLSFAVVMNAFADDNSSAYKLTINGVSVVFTDGKTILEPIVQDGVVYVPLESFLQVMNIDYKVSGTEYILSTSFSTGTAANTPEITPTPTKTPYESLSGANKKVLDLFLPYVKYFHDPSSVSIIEVRKGKSSPSWHGGYFIKVSASNKLGGKVQSWYPIGTPNGEYDMIDFNDGWNLYKYADDANSSYDIAAINKALKYKLEEMGY